MKADQQVVKHNTLIRARYEYTLAEMRTILSVIAQIDRDDTELTEYTLRADELAEVIDSSRQNIYQQLQQLGRRLTSKPLKIDREGGGFLICNWISSFEYKPGEGRVVCTVEPKLKPYLLQIKSNFTRYELQSIISFRSVHSMRLYEILKSWQGAGACSYSIDELRDLLGVGNKYKSPYDFKRYVLQRAVDEINSAGDLQVIVNYQKRGRQVVGVQFEIEGGGDLQGFISRIRTERVNEVLHRENKIVLSCSATGRLYDQTTGKDFTAEQAKKLWQWLFDNQKELNL